MDSDSEDVDAKENDIAIDFKANQVSTSIHLEDFHNCKPPLIKAVLHYHLGQDLSGHDSSLGIVSNFIDTNPDKHSYGIIRKDLLVIFLLAHQEMILPK